MTENNKRNKNKNKQQQWYVVSGRAFFFFLQTNEPTFDMDQWNTNKYDLIYLVVPIQSIHTFGVLLVHVVRVDGFDEFLRQPIDCRVVSNA